MQTSNGQERRLVTERYSERTLAEMTVNAVIGTCYAIELLNLPEDERVELAKLLLLIEATAQKRIGNCCNLLGHSALSVSEEALSGKGRVDLQNLPRSIVGVASAAEILGETIPWEIRYRLFQINQALQSLATAREVIIPESARSLADEVFADTTNLQDSPEYRALEPLLQASHSIASCGDEYWDPAWDRKVSLF